jgi:hypothetical protein
MEVGSLRIGNKFHKKDCPAEWTVAEIYIEEGKYRVGFMEQSNDVFAEDLIGIRILPERLEEYAFAPLDDKKSIYGLVNRNFTITLADEATMIWHYHYGEDEGEVRVLKYFHELQNLYYGLAMEDLIEMTHEDAMKRPWRGNEVVS